MIVSLFNKLCIALGGSMKFRFPTVLMIITIAFSLIVITSSLPPALAELTSEPTAPVVTKEIVEALIQQHDGIDKAITQADQIKLLVGAVGLLFFGYMWWIQRYISRNDNKIAEIAKTANSMEKLLAALKGEHDLSFRLRGCAGDSDELKKAIQEALTPFKAYIHQRATDDPNEISVTARKLRDEW